MRVRMIIAIAAVTALGVPAFAPAADNVKVLSIYEFTIVPPDGVLAQCQLTATGGKKNGTAHSAAGVTCNRPMLGMYATTDAHRHAPAPTGFVGWGYDTCGPCTSIKAEAYGDCYGACPPGFSWSGQYGNHAYYLIDYPAGSVITKPAGIDCTSTLTRMTCTGETYFTV